MHKIFKFSIILLLLFNIFSVGVLTARAADDTQPTGLLPVQTGSGPACPTDPTTGKESNCGRYSLNDFLQIAVNISQIILGLVGSLALLAFVAGGLMMMLSAGNAEWVTRGKQAVIGAVIGLVIVFTSYMIIQLVFDAMGIQQAKLGKWAISGWFKSDLGPPSAEDIYNKCYDNINNKKDTCFQSCDSQSDANERQKCIYNCELDFEKYYESEHKKCSEQFYDFNPQ